MDENADSAWIGLSVYFMEYVVCDPRSYRKITCLEEYYYFSYFE